MAARLRRRNPGGGGGADDGLPGAAAEDDECDKKEQVSLFKARVLKDVLARCCWMGIFITENIMHAAYFEFEVDNMVVPALAPLPREVAVCLHIVHIVFGFFGAIFVILSGWDTAGRTALTKGTSMMLVFMGTITWTWWINRHGIPYWELDPYPFWDMRCSAEKRNRTVHILKNISIAGALVMFQQMAKYEHQAMAGKPSFFEGLVTALRPWTFTTVLATQLVTFAVLRCLLKFELPGYVVSFSLIIAVCALQAVANLVNSFVDFKKGIDTKDTAGDRTLVDNLVSPFTLTVTAVICFVWANCFFIWSVVVTGFNPVLIGIILAGIAMAFGYTAGPAPLKYIGMGDVAVFCAFGPMAAVFTSVIFVGSVHWEVVFFSAPVALYVVAVLHANNYRDIESDGRTGAKTFAIILGPKASLVYYDFLLVLAHAIALLAAHRCSCWGATASLLVAPQSLWLSWRIRQKSRLRTQDEETAKTTMMFGVALAMGIVIMPGQQFSALGFMVIALVVVVLKLFTD